MTSGPFFILRFATRHFIHKMDLRILHTDSDREWKEERQEKRRREKQKNVWERKKETNTSYLIELKTLSILLKGKGDAQIVKKHRNNCKPCVLAPHFRLFHSSSLSHCVYVDGLIHRLTLFFRSMCASSFFLSR